MPQSSVLKVVALAAQLLLSGCVTLIAPYDATFDQSLNKLSEDTAKFTALAAAGGPERLKGSKETAAYYAATYNLLDRLSARAQLSRGTVVCPTNASLKAFSQERTRTSPLPEDYAAFDCREFQLYSVRYYVDQLSYGHRNDGTLNKSEATLLGSTLQRSIAGAIQTVIVNKP